MQEATSAILSYSGGELDPRYWGRTDLNKYTTAMRLSHNGYPHLQGGWSNRAGTIYAGTAKYGDTYDFRMVAFEYSLTQGYAIEFGNYYARFYTNVNGTVGPLIGGPLGGTYAWNSGTTYSQGTIVGYGITTGGFYVNAYLSLTNNNLNNNPSSSPTNWYALTPVTQNLQPCFIVEVPTPYASTDLALLKFDQSADTMFIVHPSYPPATLVRSSNPTLGYAMWSYNVINFGATVGSPTAASITNGTNTTPPLLSVTTSTGSGVQYAVTAVVGGVESPMSNIVQAARGSVLSWTSVPSATAYYLYVQGDNSNIYASPSQFYRMSNSGPQTSPTTTIQANSLTSPPSASSGQVFCVSSVDSSNHESLPSNNCYGAQVTGSTGNTISWTAPTGQAVNYYNIYCQYNGVWGLVAIAQSGQTAYTFPNGTYTNNIAITPDVSKGIPQNYNPFGTAGNYPGTCAFDQGRLWFGRTNNAPSTFWASRSGDYTNFNSSSTTVASDSFNFTMLGNGRVNEIKRIFPMPIVSVIGTSGGVWGEGNPGDQAITGTNPPTLKPVDSAYGFNDMRPISVGNKVLFFDNTSQVCRDLYYQVYQYSNTGSEMSIWAPHLWYNYTAVDWASKRTPDYQNLIVRSDGKLVGLSYKREEGTTDFVAWYWYDTQGQYKTICSVDRPDGYQDIYYGVRRYINGSWTRYIEVQAQRNFTSAYDGWFLDCAQSYGTPITVTGITKASTGVITAPSHGLSTGDTVRFYGTVGMEQLWNTQYTVYVNGKPTNAYYPQNQYFIVNYIDTNTFSLIDPKTDLPINTTSFNAYVSGGVVYKCATSFSNLSQLANMPVYMVADGNIIQGTISAGGTITTQQPIGQLIVGLPYTSEMIPFAPEFNTQVGTSSDKTRQAKSVWASVTNTRGLLVGPNQNSILNQVTYTQAGQWSNPVAPVSTESDDISLEANENTREATLYFQVPAGCAATINRVVPRISAGTR